MNRYKSLIKETIWPVRKVSDWIVGKVFIYDDGYEEENYECCFAEGRWWIHTKGTTNENVTSTGWGEMVIGDEARDGCVEIMDIDTGFSVYSR